MDDVGHYLQHFLPPELQVYSMLLFLLVSFKKLYFHIMECYRYNNVLSFATMVFLNSWLFLFVDMESLRMSSAMFGRMFATGAYYICLQYASEIFPTSIRGSGLSLCEIIGGIGLFMSPWIVYLVNIKISIASINNNCQSNE